MSFFGRRFSLLVLILLAVFSAPAQEAPIDPSLVTTGEFRSPGGPIPYRIRRLPVNSFPELPRDIAAQLDRRGCLIPQTYAAHRPENVIHASLQHAGSSDWAVLCSENGTVSLLVFFGESPAQPAVLGSAMETQRLQKHLGTNVLGFNWGIDPASPEAIRQAQLGLSPRPPRPDHDALADSVIDHNTIYHYFSNGAWRLLDMPE